MMKALRFALLFVATVSAVTFSNPAWAGMVSTPKQSAADSQREAAKELLKFRLAEAGTDVSSIDARLDKLSTQDLGMLASHLQAAQQGGGVWIAVAVAVGVAVVIILLVLETFYPEK